MRRPRLTAVLALGVALPISVLAAAKDRAGIAHMADSQRPVHLISFFPVKAATAAWKSALP